jgi:hypothetical protein
MFVVRQTVGLGRGQVFNAVPFDAVATITTRYRPTGNHVSWLTAE